MHKHTVVTTGFEPVTYPVWRGRSTNRAMSQHCAQNIETVCLGWDYTLTWLSFAGRTLRLRRIYPRIHALQVRNNHPRLV